MPLPETVPLPVPDFLVGNAHGLQMASHIVLRSGRGTGTGTGRGKGTEKNKMKIFYEKNIRQRHYL